MNDGSMFDQVLKIKVSTIIEFQEKQNIRIGDRDEWREYVWLGPKIKVSTIIAF